MSNLYYKGNVISAGGGGGSVVGLKICALGDSNTQYMGDSLNDRVVALTGCKSVANFGVAGAAWGISTDDKTTTSGGSAVAMVNKLVNPYISRGYSDEYDIITLMYGTNGDADGIGTSSSTSVTTTWGAMKYCFDKLLYYFRYAKIGVLLPPQRGQGVIWENLDAIKECCGKYSVPCYDMTRSGQIPNDTLMPYSIAEQDLSRSGYGQIYFADNVHFGATGREQFYHKYARFIESLV